MYLCVWLVVAMWTAYHYRLSGIYVLLKSILHAANKAFVKIDRI